MKGGLETVLRRQIASTITIQGLSKIPLTFWYDRTSCASPLRALARVRISANPIHRMQNQKDFCVLVINMIFFMSRQICQELCGLAVRSHWRKCYYIKPRFMRSWTGGTSTGTISLAHVLRGSCARGPFGQTRFFTKHYIVDLLMKGSFQ